MKPPPRGWEPYLIGEGLAVAPRVAEKFAGLPGLEVVFSQWATSNQPSRAQVKWTLHGYAEDV